MGRLIDVDVLKESFGDQRLDGDWCICGDETTARDLIDECPTVEAEPVRHGKLVYKVYDEWYAEWADCTVCGKSNHADAKYCQWCGAKLDLE